MIIIFIIIIIVIIIITYARTQVHSFLNLKSDLLKTRKHNSLYYYWLCILFNLLSQSLFSFFF